MLSAAFVARKPQPTRLHTYAATAAWMQIANYMWHAASGERICNWFQPALPHIRTFQFGYLFLPFSRVHTHNTFRFPFRFSFGQAPQSSLQPQINEITRNIEGFPLYASNLQLRVHIDDQRFISKSEVLELRCSADIMGLAILRRESRTRTTILALKDNGYNQRLTENGTCASARAGESGVPEGELIISVPYTLPLKWMRKSEYTSMNRESYKIIELTIWSAFV